VNKKIVYSMVASVATLALTASGFEAKADDPTVPFNPIPAVFQAAGPDAVSIQGMVDRFRAELGGINNGNAPGPIDGGRREINWDGGGSTATAVATTPFAGFLVTRGALFTTPGTGFVQAPVEGLATTFGNPDFVHRFRAFSPVRLFNPINSNVTVTEFFLPGGGNIPAVTKGFGAVFADVDQPDGLPREEAYTASLTSVSYYDVHGTLLYSSVVPPSPGDGTFSFFGAVFSDARVAKVVIVTGGVELGPYGERRADLVVMDDFIYAEPKVVK
jgi:hypothetical protein